jgi:hypothetical protein
MERSLSAWKYLEAGEFSDFRMLVDGENEEKNILEKYIQG